MIEMAVDKQVALVEPFFGHAAAIAATVHLYYCCASAARLQHKSNIDFEKCRIFLKSLTPCSAACGALVSSLGVWHASRRSADTAKDRKLDKMTQIATDSDKVEVADWVPSKIYLSVPLMWDILQFNATPKAEEGPASSLLDASLTPVMASADESESSTLEIIVAKSSEITVNIADGGKEHLLCRSKNLSSPRSLSPHGRPRLPRRLLSSLTA